jgi:transcriptional regulator with XRE-family HTH domain
LPHHLNVRSERGERQAVLGAQIRRIRKAAGMSQQDLALRLGLHTMTISYYERGEWTPPAERLEQIAEALGVEVSTLHGPVDESTAANNVTHKPERPTESA